MEENGSNRPRRHAGIPQRLLDDGAPGAAAGFGSVQTSRMPPAVGVVPPPRHISREVVSSHNPEPAGRPLAQGLGVVKSSSASVRARVQSNAPSSSSFDDSGARDDDDDDSSPHAELEAAAAAAAATKGVEDEGEDERGGSDVPGEGRGLASPRGASSTPRKMSTTNGTLQASIDKAKVGLAYTAWSKDLLRKTCHLRGIGGMSLEKEKAVLVAQLQQEDGRRRWLQSGQVAYVDDLHMLVKNKAKGVCLVCV